MKIAATAALAFGLGGAVGLASAPGAAHAGQMAVGELSGVESQEQCMERAKQMLTRYRDARGASAISEDQWTLYLWNGEYADYDVVVMCPVVDGESAGFMVVHGGDDGDALAVLNRISRLW